MMKHYAPKTLEELFASLGKLTPQSKIISGGTDLIIRLHGGSCEPDALLYMGSVKELHEIKEADGAVVVGAAATMTEIENCPLLNKHFGALIDSAADVGSPQIRNNGTIGGNVGNASPAGDLIPVLFLLNAEVEIATPKGIRRAPIAQVVLGPSKLGLTPNEAIARIILPLPKNPAYRSAFVKLGFRGKVTISRIGLTLGMVKDADGVINAVEVVAGAISLTPVHVEKAEQILTGKKLTDELALEAAQALADLIMEITPEKFDRDYKVWAAKGVMCDVLAKF